MYYSFSIYLVASLHNRISTWFRICTLVWPRFILFGLSFSLRLLFFAWFCELCCVEYFEYFICLRCSWPICVPYLIVQYPEQSRLSENVENKHKRIQFVDSFDLKFLHHTAVRVRVTLVAQFFNNILRIKEIYIFNRI